MNGQQKLFLLIVGVLMIVVATRFGLNMLGDVTQEDIGVSERTTEEQVEPEPVKTKEYVNIFFIGQNENHEEVYRAVKREYDSDIDGSKLKYAVNALVLGPKPAEKAKGVYTEIPSGTNVIYVKEYPDKVIVNLSQEFEKGGGTDSLYKRLYQLIKTSRHTSDIPVYLYIEGQRADVIGGDGIMLSQPLSDRSLDE